MTAAQSKAAKARYERESQVFCPTCHGSGRVLSKTVSARSRKGGTAAYLRSLQPGQPSMSERGQKGGRPRELTLAEVRSAGSQNGGMQHRRDRRSGIFPMKSEKDGPAR